MTQGDAQDRMAGRSLLMGIIMGVLAKASGTLLAKCDMTPVYADDGEVIAIDVAMASGNYRIAIIDLPPNPF